MEREREEVVALFLLQPLADLEVGVFIRDLSVGTVDRPHQALVDACLDIEDRIPHE